HCLELSAVVAEADDHRAGVEALEGLEQQVDALVADQLAEVEDRRATLREEGLEALGVSGVGLALVTRCVAAGFVDQARERLRAGLGPELVDVDSGGYLVDPVDVADDLVQHLADVLGADEDRRGGGESLFAP